MAAPIDYIARYKLQNNADDEAGSFNGIEHGDTYFDGEGAVFDGDSDYIFVDSNPFSGQTSCSISFWVNLNNINADGAIISKWTSVLQVLLYHDAPNGWRFLLADGSSLIADHQSSTTGVVGEWRHIVFTWESGDYTSFYESGSFISKNGATSSGVIGDASDFYIGIDETARDLDGILADVRIFNRKLIDSEILETYNEGMNGDDLTQIDFLIVSENIAMNIIDFSIVSSVMPLGFIGFDIISENKTPEYIDFNIVSIAHKGELVDLDITSTNTKDPEFINLNIISENIPSDAENPESYNAQIIRRIL